MSINSSSYHDVEHKAWKFQNMDKIFPCQLVEKGEKSSCLEHNKVQFDDFRIEDQENANLDLPSFLEETDTDGLIVLHNDEIAFEYYGRTNNAHSKHAMMSMTKSVVGLVAGILVGQGKLDVNKLVSTYVPEVTNTAFVNVTVRQCLDMRSGLKYDNANLTYRKASGLIPWRDDEEPMDLHQLLSTLQSPIETPIDGPDGIALNYLSISAELLGWVMERASGRGFAELVSQALWQPMQAESRAYVVTDPGGNARTSGGMSATLRDIARLGQLVLHDDNGIVPASWIHDMIRKGSKQAFNAASWQKDLRRFFKTVAYRSYWLADSDSETLIALGIHGQLIMIDRINGIVMAKVSSQPTRLDTRKKHLAVAAFQEFQRILIKEKKWYEERTRAQQVKSDESVGAGNGPGSVSSFFRMLCSCLKG